MRVRKIKGTLRRNFAVLQVVLFLTKKREREREITRDCLFYGLQQWILVTSERGYVKGSLQTFQITLCIHQYFSKIPRFVDICSI